MSTSKTNNPEPNRGLTKPAAAALLACATFACASALTGCSRKPTKQMRFFAEKSLAALDSANTNIQTARAQITSCKHDPCEQPGRIEQNPAYSLLVAAKDGLDLFDVRRREYESSLKNSKQSKTDAAAAAQLETVRDAFAQCAYATSHELKDRLVKYRVWTGAKPPDITAKTRTYLGIPGSTPPAANACAKYTALHDQALKQLAPPQR